MSDIGDCGECGMPAQLVTCVHDDFGGQDCPGSLGGSPWRPSALDADTTPDDLRQVRERGFADGRLAAFADATDLTPLLANRSGLVDPTGELHGIASDSDDDVARGRLTRIARAIRGED